MYSLCLNYRYISSYFQTMEIYIWNYFVHLINLIKTYSLTEPLNRSIGKYKVCTVSVLGREEGYTVKYSPSPEGVPEGEAITVELYVYIGLYFNCRASLSDDTVGRLTAPFGWSMLVG